MTLVADTNILVRALMQDSPAEGRKAAQLLRSERVVVPTVVFCEMVWVLRRIYKLGRPDIIRAFTALLGIETIMFDRTAVEAGIAIMEAGGDFADGVIALEGRRLGGDVFATFDKKAAALLKRAGYATLAVTEE